MVRGAYLSGRFTSMHKAISAALPSVLLMMGCMPAPDAELRSTPTLLRFENCRVQEVSRFRLLPSTDQMAYIEPHAMATDSHGVALALGRYSVLLQNDGRRWVHTEDEFLIGGVMRPDGSGELVRSSISKDVIQHIRIAALSTGGWGVVLLEASEPKAREVRRLWRGRFGDGGWLSLDSISIPDGLEVRSNPTSTLVGDGEEYNLLLGGVLHGQLTPVVVRDVFRDPYFEVMPNYYFSDGELLYSSERGLAAAVLRPVPGGRGHLSMYLLRGDSSWNTETLLHSAWQQHGGYAPRFTGLGVDSTSWLTSRIPGGGVWALRNPWGASPERFEIDPTAQNVVPIASPHYEKTFWLLSHFSGTPSDSIRVVYLAGDQARTAGRLDGFPLGPFHAAPMPGRRLLVHGAQSDTIDGGVVYSIFVTAEISCDSDAGRR
jgi:hypothetical protein